MTSLCAICDRLSRGFGFKSPQHRVNFLAAALRPNRSVNHTRQHFCSMQCQDIFYEMVIREIQVNKTDLEIKAEQSVLIPLGDYVAGIGMEKSLAEYSKEQIKELVNTILTSYHTELQRLTQDEIPF